MYCLGLEAFRERSEMMQLFLSIPTIHQQTQRRVGKQYPLEAFQRCVYSGSSLLKQICRNILQMDVRAYRCSLLKLANRKGFEGEFSLFWLLNHHAAIPAKDWAGLWNIAETWALPDNLLWDKTSLSKVQKAMCKLQRNRVAFRMATLLMKTLGIQWAARMYMLHWRSHHLLVWAEMKLDIVSWSPAIAHSADVSKFNLHVQHKNLHMRKSIFWMLWTYSCLQA